MRLHKPIGSLLLLWPTLWGLFVASKGNPSFLLLMVFVAGVVLMRSAGCVINDYADRHFDGEITRTKNRPIVSGQVTSREALGLFLILCLLAASLLFWLNPLARWLAIPAITLAIIYPFTKRITQVPQLILGLAFSWGIPMAFAAATGTVPSSAWFLFLIACLWPIAYDTLYAMIDRPDDLRIGIKSTAILFGNWDTKIVALLHMLILLLLIIFGVSLSFNTYYYLGIASAALVMTYQQYLIKDRTPQHCLQAFLHSQWAGCFILCGIILNYIR